MQRIAGLLIALAAVILTGCGGGDGDTTTPIAIVGPITGQYASFGAQMKNGGEMAVADINEAGGVLGIGHERRYEPAMEEMRRLFESGYRVPEIFRVSSRGWPAATRRGPRPG